MLDKNRIILFLIISLVISSVFKVSLIIVNNKLFLERLQIQKTEEMLNRGEIQINKNTKTRMTLDLNIKWPWYSTIFFLGTYSIYWFSLGRISRKFFTDKTWIWCLLIPGVIGLLSFNLYYLLYILSCYAGGKFKK